MDNIVAARRSLRVGLLCCLLGTPCIIVSYFWLPLYSQPLGDPTWAPGPPLTAWEFVQELIHNMDAQHNPSGFIVPIGLTLLPVVAALILGLLAVGRFAAPRPWLALLYLVVFVAGAVPVILFFAFVGPFGLLRFGFVVGVLGYVLLLLGDLAFRGAAAKPVPA